MRFGICHSRTLTITLIGAAIFSIGPAWAKGHHDLAKASQNPLSSLISVPFENNSNFNVGPEDAYTNVLNIKPVYPVNLGEWNLINRAILPVIYQDQRFPGEGSDFGLGNLTYQGFFSPAKVGKLIWGAGPSVVLPTRTSDRFGSETLAF